MIAMNLPAGLEISRVQAGDAAELSQRLREIDIVELRAEADTPPLTAIERSIEASGRRCYAVRECGIGTLGVFGFAPSQRDARGGRIWLLGSDRLTRHSRAFAQYSRPWIQFLIDDFEVAFNFVSADNTIAIRWLKWCGFEFIKHIPEYGLTRQPFWLFARANGADARARWADFFEQGSTENRA